MKIFENNHKKLARQLVSLITETGKNNYQPTHIKVRIHANGITVSTVCINEYGSWWYNENDTFVPLAKIPFFTLQKFYYFCSDD